ncbi:MAG: hypothetical protein J0H68_09830 [Sphingobacteriia bacterium]|nr:hypothetical protein [Sphingobacteriia bacterium]
MGSNFKLNKKHFLTGLLLLSSSYAFAEDLSIFEEASSKWRSIFQIIERYIAPAPLAILWLMMIKKLWSEGIKEHAWSVAGLLTMTILFTNITWIIKFFGFRI